MAANLPDFTTYVDFRLQINKPWLDGPWGRAWQTAMGKAWDAEYDLLKAAGRVGWPEHTPSDALGPLGSERGLWQFPSSLHLTGETEAEFRLLLKNAWGAYGQPLPTPDGPHGTPAVQRYSLPQGFWEKQGTPGGHIANFLRAGLTSVAVYRQHEWSFPPYVGGPLFNQWQQKWSTFYIVITQPHAFAALHWGDPGLNWGPMSGTWGSTALPTEVNALKSLVTQYSSGHSTCAAIVLQLGTGRLWGTGAWADGGTWGGTGLMSIVWPVGERHWWEPETVWPIV